MSVSSHTTSSNFTGTSFPVTASGPTLTGGTDAPPQIQSVNPTSGVVGAQVTITGTKFGATQGSSSVKFGGVAATVSSWSDTTIVASVPTGLSVGSAPIVVNVPGANPSNSEPFSVIAAAPVISGFTPASAPIGSSISITGSNFALNGATPQVVLAQQGGGTIIAPIASATNTSISFTIPPGAATGAITVTSGGLSGTSSSPLTVVAASTFTVTAGPSSVTLLPGQTTTVEVSLTSTNGFTQGASLSVSGLPSGVTATFQPSQITAGQSSVLTLSASAAQNVSSTQLTIGANSIVQGISLNSSATVTLNVRAAGNVAFAGRVAVTGDPYNTPIVGLTVRFTGRNYTGTNTGCNSSVQTDASGNFLFSGLPEECSGAQIVQYDPSTVSAPPGKYSGVNLSYVLTPGQVTTPGIVVHLPRVDNAETLQVAQNSSIDQIFASKSIPNLTIVVYAGTTLSLADGSKPDPFPLSLVEIPYDHLPEQMFPDPTQVPVYAMSIEPFNSSSSQPVAVFYPNRSNAAPGTTMPLSSLNPTLGMMVNYGTGTVSDDSTQVIPDRDPAYPGHAFGISHFDWFFPEPPPTPLSPSPDPNSPKSGDPVDPASGLLVINKTDIAFGGARGQVAITRTYRPLLSTVGPFGVGTSDNYNYFLQLTPLLRNGSVVIDVRLCAPDGNQFSFAQQQDGTYTNSTIPTLAGAVLSKVFDGTYNLRWKNGSVYQFQLPSPTSSQSFLTSITDTNGNTTTIVRNSSAEIQQIIDPVGRALNFSYSLDSQGQTGVITTITDPIGRTVQYGYDLSSGKAMLTNVTDPDGGLTTYGYDGQNRLASITDPRRIEYLQNTYYDDGRVKTQLAADGGLTQFSYILFNSAAPTSPVAQAYVTDPLGNQTIYHFNPQGFLLDTTDALGRKTVYTRASGTNLLTSTTDPLGRVTAYTYDSKGNPTSITRLAGMPGAATTTFVYDPTFNKVTSITDPLQHTTTFTYDPATGNLTATTDALQKQSTFGYDQFGELTSSVDPLQNTTRFGYLNGDPVSTTDPLQRVTTKVMDGVGRLVGLTTPLGQTTRYQYNGLNQVTALIDPVGNETDFSFDPNGNISSVVDANRHTTSFTYDSMDRLASRMDPLLNTDSYLYDQNGNLTQFTDRRNKVSAYTYDALNRRAGATYGSGESSISYSYDQGGRLIQASDSMTGTIARAYNGLDLMLSENASQGSITYSYDLAGRRTGMQASGQAATSYSYDPDNRLTQISQGSSAVSITYDIAGRRTSVTLPNGIAMSYGYDAASQLVGINYQIGNTLLGNLTYSYDLAGHRAGIGGSFARTGLPQAVGSGTYNAANQVTQFGTSSLSYDLDGNVIGDGVNSYTWDARNRLVSISGGVSAAFQYDPFGRRITTAVGGATTNYLYDSVNTVEELSGGLPAANLLAGLRTDEYFQRNDALGSGSLLTDALNSTVAIADSGGSVFVNYTYEPFGKTTQAGSSTSSYGFTGRENDRTGLYFDRARYYSPQLQRFISEDPAGLLSGTNLYQYAYDSPTNHLDPSGLAPILPDWLANHVNWNYVPAVCNADSFRFYGGGGGSENVRVGAYQLDDVHYANNGGNWQVDGTESDTLYEASRENGIGGGAVMHGRKPKEALLFPPSPYHADFDRQLGPAKVRAEAGLGPLIGYSKDGISVGFYGDVGLGGGVGKYGGGFAFGGGWSVTFSSAASCVAH